MSGAVTRIISTSRGPMRYWLAAGEGRAEAVVRAAAEAQVAPRLVAVEVDLVGARTIATSGMESVSFPGQRRRCAGEPFQTALVDGLGPFHVSYRMMISTRRFRGSRTPGPVGTSRCVSPKPWIAIALRGTPSRTSSAATFSARRTDRRWL